MYGGHLFVASKEWIRFALSGDRSLTGFCATPDDSGGTNTGDPVFILCEEDGDPAIHLHAGISSSHSTSAELVVRNWGRAFGVQDISELSTRFRLPSLSPESTVQAILLQDAVEVVPQLQLDLLGIQMQGAQRYRGVDPDAVLTILRALPGTACTSWTNRVVARDNNLPDRAASAAVLRHTDPERRIDDPESGFQCNIHGQAPVRAEGRSNGLPFNFFARLSVWRFTLVLRPDVEPANMWPENFEPGFFTKDGCQGFYLEQAYGECPQASFMRYDEAERIIRSCVQTYLQARSGV
jgi:hypothetical protein